MTDVITFDVELTENQKMAQHKLYQVHKLYDEIEKLLGTQDVFNKPHMLLVLPNKLKKEPMTNEEWFCNLDTEDKAREISDMTAQGYWSEELVEKWLKEKHDDL